VLGIKSGKGEGFKYNFDWTAWGGGFPVKSSLFHHYFHLILSFLLLLGYSCMHPRALSHIRGASKAHLRLNHLAPLTPTSLSRPALPFWVPPSNRARATASAPSPVFSSSFHSSPLSLSKKKMPPKKKQEEAKKTLLGRPGNNLKVSRVGMLVRPVATSMGRCRRRL
jgi:hypothetical protein